MADWSRRAVLGGATGVGLVMATGIPVRANDPGLRVHGRRILFGATATPPRGVAVGDPLLARAERPVSDYARLARNWQARVVRLTVHPGLWRADPATMRDAVRREVGAARAQGLVVVLAWHAIGWPDGPYERPTPERQLIADAYDTDLGLAHGFWTEMAQRFADQPDVGFEIWNEPVRLDAPKGLSPPGADWRDLRPVWTDLVAAIRTVAPNLVLATGGAWAADLTGIRETPLDGENIGYAWHVYPGTGGGAVDCLADLLDGLPQTQAVMVTEWGFSDKPGHLQGDAAGFGEMFTDRFLDRYDLGWSAWCWHPDWQPPLVEADWTTPTPAGALVRSLLRAKAD